MEVGMRDFMFQTWADINRRWHWVIFKEDANRPIESPRDFDSREEAQWDAKRFIGVH
jgi:hypothetical protein